MKLLSRRYFYVLAFLYSLFIVYCTTVPFRFDSSRCGQILTRFLSMWQDILQPSRLWVGLEDVIQNIILYLFLGIFLKNMFLPHHKHNGWKVAAVSLYGFLLSYSIESFQAAFPGRGTSMVDVVVNGFSCVFGILITWISQISHFNRYLFHRFVKTLRNNPYGLCAGIVGFVIVLGALFPFNLVPHFVYIGSRSHFENLDQFFTDTLLDPQFLAKALFTLNLYALFSFLMFVSLIYKDKRSSFRAIFFVLSASLAMVSASEFLQILFPPGYFELSQILFGIIGSLLGCGLGQLMRYAVTGPIEFSVERGRRLVDGVFVIPLSIISFMIVIDWLRPFHVVSSYAAIWQDMVRVQFNPFTAYSQTLFWMLEGFFRKFFLFAGWSIFMFLWMVEHFSKIRVTPFWVALISASTAVILEVIQIPVVGHVFSLNEFLWAFLAGFIGGSFGLLIAKSKGSRSYYFGQIT